jgi:EAL domain-containing protein (putative c-di-GMP-specific phosphodiesterase class I)
MRREVDADAEQLRRLLVETARLERLQSTLLDNIVEGVLLQDASGRVITSNSAARQILGLEAAGLHGRLLDKLRSAMRSDGTPWPAEERPTAATVSAGAGLRGRIVGVHVGDQLKWLSLNTDPVLAPSGEVEYVVSSIRDVTDEHAAEQAEQQAARARRERVETLLRDGGPSIVVQPIVELATGITVGAEALARFPDSGGSGPESWFADATAVGLGVELELAAVERALATLDRLPADLYLSLNASPAALGSPRLIELLTEGPADRLVLELTEHVAVGDYDVLAGPLNRLRYAGVRLAVDDAGSGFASLQHILNLAPDIIKLDHSLVRDVDTDPARASLAGCLVLFADRIGATLVAEGIEADQERATLQGLGVRYGQGFHLGVPVSVGALADSLPSRPHAHELVP